ncbi:NACHT and WD40 repeat domain-containing protein [Paractinoplanes deccanensis]|nr:WD40 repeat domain-containing protein [Actinoplanes deccanensis]
MKRIRDTRRLLITAIVAITAGGVVGIAASDAGWAAAVGGAAALLVAAGNILIDLFDYFRSEVPAAKLPAVARELAEAVEEQWSKEATSRGLRDAAVLPLRWTATDRDVSDLASLTGDTGGRPIRVNLDGGMRDEFEDAIADLAGEYARIPSGRLVILGEPGAGKTVLALLLTLGLIRRRPEDGKVPVLLSVANWDPVLRELDDWLVETIAVAYYNGQRDVPRELLRGGWVLPVLDGLDEIPESARRKAIEYIHRSLRRDRPIVVTCRSNEYEDTIMDGSPVLSRAPVIELSPITADDLEAYLPHQRWRPGTSWTAVLTRIRQRPQGPLALAFSTPLTVSLARLVYRRLPEFPDELLVEERFHSRHAVEDSLTARTVRAAYASESVTFPVSRAERYLAFLARYLHGGRERDFAWWRLAERQLSVWTGPALGLVLGLLVMIAVAVWVSLSDLDEQVAAEQTVLFGSTVGAVFAGLVAVLWLTGARQLPGRLSFRIRGSARRLAAGFRFGSGAVAVLAVPVLAGYALTISLTDTWSVRSGELFAQATGVAVALSALLGVVVAVQRWLQDTDGPAAPVDPLQTLRSDRLLSLVAALVGGGMVAALLYPALILGAWAGGLAEDVLSHWSGWPGGPDLTAMWHARDVDFRTKILPAAGALVPMFLVLPGVTAFVLILLARPWPRYVLASWTLAARRDLPVRISRFLTEAHTLGLLRRSTGTYQFRHVRLQEQLATSSIDAHDQGKRPAAASSQERARTVPVRGLIAAALALGLTAVLAATLPVDQPDSTRHGSYDLLVLDGTAGAPLLRRWTSGPYEVSFAGAAANDTHDAGAGLMALFSPNDPVVRIFSPTGATTSIVTGPSADGVLYAGFGPGGQWLYAVTEKRDDRSESEGVNAGFWKIIRDEERVAVGPQVSLGVIDRRRRVFFSENGETFGIERPSGAFSTVDLWSAADGAARPSFPSAGVELPPAAPDALIGATDLVINRSAAGGYELRSVVTGKPIRSLQGLRGDLEAGSVFNAANTAVVTYSSQDVAQMWTLTPGTPPTDLGRPAEGSAVRFSDDGRRVFVLGEDGAVRVWDASRPNTRIAEISPVADKIVNYSIDSKGTVLVAEGKGDLVYAWQVAARPMSLIGDRGLRGAGVSLSRGGTMMRIGGADGTTRALVLDGARHDPFVLPASIYDTVTDVLLDGWVAVHSAGDSVTIRRAEPGGITSDTIHDLDFSADPQATETSFAVALTSGAVEVHDRDGTCRVRLFGHSGRIASLTYSPDPAYLASSGYDGTVRLWHLPPPRGPERCD